MTKSSLTPASANIFEDLGFPPQEAEHLMIRADLMLQVRRHIEAQQWTTEQAASKCQTSIDLIESLMQGKIGQFTIEQLIMLLSRAGMKVRLEVTPNAA